MLRRIMNRKVKARFYWYSSSAEIANLLFNGVIPAGTPCYSSIRCARDNRRIGLNRQNAMVLEMEFDLYFWFWLLHYLPARLESWIVKARGKGELKHHLCGSTTKDHPFESLAYSFVNGEGRVIHRVFATRQVTYSIP
ncbi:hypothetical protein V6R21_18955 [Limibacter armeniacum]|uniref:hypothetical protein n=1 Tax=Limibacter armeniacum TaxID=466084 RepID=UPI002FE68F8D